ncbi:3-oxo-tetronate kinase [Granulosicoccus sp. 3-233]|uniref:3-oxo-tetronate kinase n=1 Tax=Granulosicoccus sp. 3-233 TaxID=3417969 RepID=UPI003D32EF07
MNTILGCIADDFTGATDLASILARSGVPINIRLGTPSMECSVGDDPVAAFATAPFEIIALKCRTSPVKEAVSETRNALHWLQAQGARQFYWKYCSTFDSTDQGNIGPVAESLLQQLSADDAGKRQTVYCPAFPENGRSVYNSHLFVGTRLLSDSPMKDHPLTPMRNSNLLALLEPQTTMAVGAIRRSTVRDGSDAIRRHLHSLAEQKIVHVVVDAIDMSDLRAIAEATIDMPLITGGSALALHLPELYRQRGWLNQSESIQAMPKTRNASIVLSGSCSAMTRKQVARYCQQVPSFQLDPLKLATENQLEQAKRWLDTQNGHDSVMIYSTAAPERVCATQEQLGRERGGELVEKSLASLAVHACNNGVQRVVTAGGETSGAVVKALGVATLQVSQEIAPGVPWTFSRRQGENVALALKSGNFGEEDFFERALGMLNETPDQ